jgi:protein-L-isoaspartate(D-aspartate) O-methyltransferase
MAINQSNLRRRTDGPADRERMVSAQLAGRGITDRRVLNAMRRVPRDAFVTPGMEEFAYEDSPLPIAEGQTISQPYIVAAMIESAEVRPGQRVLEVGTGSGYAAAVLAEIAHEVYTIERHKALADVARERFARLGYDNIHVRHGDGTLGWPEAAPFDAILVTAGGPEIPQALRMQLKLGGRMIIPVGDIIHHQRLVKVVRRGEHEFAEQELEPVRFVPLIGEQGWTDTGAKVPTRAPKQQTAAELIRDAAVRLPPLEDPAFGQLIDEFAQARVVLLGEASHGTSEFYRARAAITQRLIEQHGFSIVAVEADWPDAAAIDRYVRHKEPRSDTEGAFRRFPTWMWRNEEVDAFVQWMRGLLRSGYVQHECFDPGGDRLSRQNRSGSRPCGA